MNALRCLALASLTCAVAAATDEHSDNAPRSPSEQRLGVIVPAHRGDLDRAVSSLGRWPAKCSPVTQKNVDIVLYYAEGEGDTAAAAAIPKIVDSAGRCFADTRLVYANLSEEEDIYPKGPSVQFYKMFLDEDVRAQLVEYDALAIIEWDVLVATDQSFEKLYEAAFDSTEDFWVKGSNLEGTNFHVTAESNDMWHVLGHINGNAIYKNNDSGFTEFVDYTRSRWGYKYPYDVALWATISDFPYSWPLWQRFSPKFVTTNLISNVGYEHVDKGAVADAVASGSLFIHGSMVDEGSVASWQATTTTRRSLRAKEDDVKELACTTACGRVGAGLPVGASTVCDATCAEGGRFDGYLCGAGSSIKFGSMCRLCFNDVEEARKAESRLNNGKHVIMCDTMRPPAAVDCSDECTINKDTVCDEACGTGLYGDYSCNWRNLGAKCRSCFDDVEAALEADEVAKRHGGRVIMCDTHEPPNVSVDVKPIAARSRKLQPWRDNQKWKTIEKWQGNDDTEPKWKTNQKWKGDDDTEPKWKTTNKYKTNVCLDGCESDDRICDSSCKNGDPYGKLGCNTLDGDYGRYCRACYNDETEALAADSAANRAIMCATGEPVTPYATRQLRAKASADAPHIARELQPWRDNQKWKTIEKWQGNDDTEPKWKTNQKWKGDDDTEPKWKTTNKYKTNVCLDGCESDDRICDSSCKNGDPYGKLGCNTLDGDYGRYCRACYNDETEALAADSAANRAIMCDTKEPVTPYATRQLRAEASAAAPHIARELQPWRDNQKWKTIEKWQGNDDTEPKWKTNQKWKGDDDTEPKWKTTNKYKTNVCLDGCESDDRICDSSCKNGDPYGKLGCNTLDGDYGRYCRACYNDETEALAADSAANRAIMCDTGEPVTPYATRQLRAEASADAPHIARELQPWRDNQKWKTIEKWQGNDDTEPKWKTNQKWKGDDDTEPKWKTTNKYKTNVCLDGCESDDRICDSSCKNGDPYGKLGCNTLDGDYGRYCRACYNDETEAVAADSAANRAIMCATGEPVTPYATRQLRAEASADAPHIARELQPWRDNQKWKTIEKWQGNDDTEPKWKTNQKWKGDDDTEPKWKTTNKYKTNVCLDGCESDDRICDSSCKNGDPYGKLGCNTLDGDYGRYCRACYNDETEALAADSAANRAIMCATGEPVTPYATRQLRAEASVAAPHIARELQPWRDNQKWKTIEKWQGNDDTEPKWKTNQKWKGDDDTEPKWKTTNKYKTNVCLDGCESDDRICDSSCKNGDPYGKLGCNTLDGDYGRYCRACYNDETEALAADSAANRAIMCDTKEPVTPYATRQLRAEASADAPHIARELQPWRDNQKWKTIEKWQGNDDTEPKWKTNQKWKGDDDTEPKWKTTNKYKTNVCLDGCESDDRICDSSCKNGDPYGKLGCNTLDGDYGRYCRACYNDETEALAADSAANRAIMCDTKEPVTPYATRQLRAEASADAPHIARELQPWRDNQKWKTIEKWQGNDDTEPKWKTNQKWKGDDDTEPKWKTTNKYKTNVCLDGCESDDRICDSSCKNGDPYGKLGCNTLDGDYGRYCRACYNDETEALAADSAANRAIMCDTKEPVTPYATRQLRAEASVAAPHIARELQPWRDNQKWKTIEKWQGNDDTEPKWKTNQKWKGDDDTEPKWKTTNKYKTNVCLDGCESDDRICDSSCKNGDPYGKLGCNTLDGDYGRYCRACYNDETEALVADSAANRAIMCDTKEPVTPYATRQLRAEASAAAPHIARELQPWRDNQKWKTIEKWQGNDDTEPKWKTNQKWKGDDDTEPKWKTTNKYKTNVCLDGCESDDRICDSSCKNGDPYGKLGCNTLDGDYGRYCRACYNDETEALAADSAANRAIMCDTKEPVTPYATRQLRAEASAAAPHIARELQPWRDNQKWKTIEKWQGNDDTEPKWKTNQKWKGDDDTEPKWKTTNKYKTNVCLDGCESDDRICDSSCKNGDPYGKLGCNTLDGDYGRYCRACYNDETEALAADSAANRAIMCATGEPVTPYATRQLRAVDNTFDPARETPSSDLEAFISVSASTPLTNGIVRGDICAFISGGMNEIEQADVTVQSILEFVPGVRVVIAAEAGSKPAYESTAGIYPSVSVFDASSARTASLFADEYCGEGTKLIFYVETGSVISRTFTSKDTHSPRGDLLVVYSDARTSYRDFEIARATSAVLGFKAPSFTHGADLMLPVGANKDLREELTMGVDSGLTDKNAAALAALESHDVSSVPQLLAALAYSKSTPGVWFVNPQAWVTEHLFKTASIWEVPLVKPRFTCTINRSLYSSQTSAENAELLTKSLDFFQKGGLCENGVISANPQL